VNQINEFIKFFQNLTTEKIIDICIAVMIVVIFCIISSGVSYFIIKIFKWKEKDKKKIKANAFYHPVKAAIIVLGIYLALVILELPKDIMNFVYHFIEIAVICIIAKGLANIFEPNSMLMQKVGKSNRIKGNQTLANFTGKIAKAVIYVIAGIIIISRWYDLNGLIAGLGLGSVVIALAAQDIAKSLLAGASILLDKPFVVGDWIQTKDYEGTVVDITFRSTKIKTVEDTFVTVPNAKLTEEAVINYAKMEKRRYSFNIKLPLQTNSDTVETLINRIKFVLGHNKDIQKESIVVECNSILEDGINILVIVYTSITVYNDYLNFRTNVNEAILNIIESEKIRLSNPTQDICIITK
jgi:MscS family membrane protein